MADILIHGGTVVDGTGAPSFKADVRVRGDRIVEIAMGLQAQPDERLVDATDCYVAPGFIESHTHHDATMWWQPDMDPLPGYGVSTVIMGNCGFTAAPISDDPDVQLEMIKVFSFFEDIPIGPFRKFLPWDWRTWSEYRRSMESKLKTAANVAAYVGHLAIRFAVMGQEAWDRVAHPDEIVRMADHLEDALAAGALGLSSNLLDHDGQDRPVPTLKADDAEFSALFDVLERYPNSTLQIVMDPIMRRTVKESTARILRLLEGRNIRFQAAGVIPTLSFQHDLIGPMKDMVADAQARGHDIWPGFAHSSPTFALSIVHSLIFAQSGDYVWHEVVLAATEEEKLALLADPDWRARARESWKGKDAHTPMGMADRLMLRNSANGVGPINLTLQAYADALGLHPSDAMAQWFIKNGVMSTVHMPPYAQEKDLVVELMRHPTTVGNINDAPAHGQMFCGAGDNVRLFTEFVRTGEMTVEEVVHVMTGKTAGHFNLHDRGELRVGKKADIAVFNLDEIELRAEYKKFDIPTGDYGITWRYTRDAAPMRITIVNGVPTFIDGRFSGALPGQIISPTSEFQNYAEAAE